MKMIAFCLLIGGVTAQAVDSWIGPIGSHAGNTTADSKLGSIESRAIRPA